MNSIRLRHVRAFISYTAISLPARTSRVMRRADRVCQIYCNDCRSWVKPRAYDPNRYVCTDCSRSRAFHARLDLFVYPAEGRVLDSSYPFDFTRTSRATVGR